MYFDSLVIVYASHSTHIEKRSGCNYEKRVSLCYETYGSKYDNNKTNKINHGFGLATSSISNQRTINISSCTLKRNHNN